MEEIHGATTLTTNLLRRDTLTIASVGVFGEPINVVLIASRINRMNTAVILSKSVFTYLPMSSVSTSWRTLGSQTTITLCCISTKKKP